MFPIINPIPYFVSWYLIGMLSTLIAIYFGDNQIKVSDIIGSIFLALAGPLVTLIVLLRFIGDRWDVVLIKREKK